jgi:hypothetical protein
VSSTLPYRAGIYLGIPSGEETCPVVDPYANPHASDFGGDHEVEIVIAIHVDRRHMQAVIGRRGYLKGAAEATAQVKVDKVMAGAPERRLA